MTGIPPLRGTAPIGPARATSAPTHGGFALPGAPAAPRGPDAAPAAVPPLALAGLLALQEAEPAAVRDRAARRHARALLAALTEMQRALLREAGAVEAGAAEAGAAEVGAAEVGAAEAGAAEVGAALDRLGALLGTMPPAADPALAAVLGAVALRCRIELARRE